MTFFRAALVAAVALCGFGAVPVQQQDESVFIDEVKKDFVDKIKRCEEAKDWKGLFEHYTLGLRRYAQKVVPLGADRWTSINEYLVYRFSQLPKEAYEYYRLEMDGRAKGAFEHAREEGSRRDLERAIEDFFFSSFTDENLDTLACLCFEEGRVEEAVFHWNRLLRFYPDSEIPRAVTAARIAHACRLVENEAALDDLRRHVKAAKIDGKVRVGGKEQALADYLDGLKIPPRIAAPRPLKMPHAGGPEDRLKSRTLGVRNDIKRWTYDFSDKGDTAVAPAAAPARARVWRRGGEVASPFGEFPLFPAYAQVRGKDYVIFTNGQRVVAVDPSRVKGNSTTTGIYWKYPSGAAIARSNPNAQQSGVAFGQAYIGVSVDGEQCYVTMFSPNRPRDQNPNNYDFFEGPTAVKCFDIRSGKLLWDTDSGSLLEDMKKFDFYERNFSFCGPPLVRGGRVFLGLCTSPVGEQESRVLCLDKKTGKPLWSTFLSSVSGGGRNMWNMGSNRFVVYQTLLEEQGGVIFAHTNLGVMGAMSAVTGNILWLTKYRRSVNRAQQNFYEPNLIRPANWPILWKGQVFVLPQDKEEILAFDKMSGRQVELPPAKTREGDLQWKNFSHLIGLVNDWMVLGGATSHVLRLRDFQAYSLASSNTLRAGRGVLHGDLCYLPAMVNQGANANNVGVLAIYDTYSWKSLDQPPWKEPGEYGNLLIAGSYLVVATQKVTIYTDVETLRREFVHRLYQSPPHADSLLEYGDTMKSNERLEEAAEAYLAFIRAAEGDPAYDARIREVKGDLHGIFIRRGDDASEKGDAARALEFYKIARNFAYDEKTAAETTRRLAQTNEKLERWKDAVAAYQELIQKARDQYHKEADNVSKLWEHAQKRIDEIVAKAPEAYEEIEKQAAEALRKAKEGGAKALEEVRKRFPNSKSAKEAWQRLLDAFREQGKLDKLPSLYGEYRSVFRAEPGFEASRDWIAALEKLGDAARLRADLPRFAGRFGDERMPGGNGEPGEKVKDYAERLLRERVPPPPPAAAPGPLRKAGELEPLRPGSDPLAVQSGVYPLKPLGIEPPDFGPNLELLARGSSVELWDLKEHRRLWSCPRPGGYLGVVFTQAGPADTSASVTAVKAGSPAERAGLAKGDVLVSVGGRSVRTDTLSDALASFPAGSAVEVVYKRGEEFRKAQVELAPHPAELRPAIVGAAFTRDYALAVAWEDAVASLDLATGRTQWTFRALRDRFVLREFHATDGRLYLFEVHKPERDRDLFHSPSAQLQQERQIFRPEDAYDRLLCLNDYTGDVAWGRAFEFDPATQAAAPSVTFLGPYLSESVAVLHGTNRANLMTWTMTLLDARDGTQLRKHGLPTHLLAWALDEPSGIFYYVGGHQDQNQRSLESLSIDPGRKDYRPLQVPLHAQYLGQNYFSCALAADANYVSLVVPPVQPGGEYRIWVFKTADGKPYRSVSLLADRTLPPGQANKTFPAPLDRDGILYVYNVPREKPATEAAARAFLTAFRIGGQGAEDPLWDAVAPVAPAGSVWWIGPEAPRFALFAAARGARPGQSPGAPLALVYDKSADGYVHMEHTELASPSDPFGKPMPPVTWWRGRFYVASKQGLQVYAP